MIRQENVKKEKKLSLMEGLKLGMFSIYSRVLAHRQTSKSYIIVLMLISFCQLQGLLYTNPALSLSSSPLGSLLTTLLDQTLLYSPIISNKSSTNLMLLLSSLGILLLLYFLSMLYTHLTMKERELPFHFPFHVVSHISLLLQWVLVVPLVTMFWGVFSCDLPPLLSQDALCGGIQHVLYACFTCVIVALAFGVMIASCFCMGQACPYVRDSLKRSDFGMELLFLVFRVVMCVVSLFFYDREGQYALVYVIIVAIANVALVKSYFLKLPYYATEISEFFGVMIAFYALSTIGILFGEILKLIDVSYDGHSEIMLCSLGLVIFLVKKIRKKMIFSKIYNTQYFKIKNNGDIDLYLYELTKMVHYGYSPVEKMILMGVASNHRSECFNLECPLRSQDDIYDNKTKKYYIRSEGKIDDPILLTALIGSMYSIHQKQDNSSAFLHIISAMFKFYQQANVHKALIFLQTAELCSCSLQQRFTIFHLKKMIEASLKKQYLKGANSYDFGQFDESEISLDTIDLSVVIHYEEMFDQLMKHIYVAASNNLEFWTHLGSLMPDLNILHKIGLKIITDHTIVDDHWNKMQQINPKYPKALLFMGEFVNLVKNDCEEGEELLKRARAFNTNKSLDREKWTDFEILFRDDSAVIVVSGNQENEGKILEASNGIFSLLGYQPVEVKGQEVNIIIPKIISVHHPSFLKKYFNTTDSSFVNAQTQTFAIHRAGFLVPITLLLKVRPSINSGINYIALLQPREKDYDFIITDPDGRIDSMVFAIAKMLNINPTFLQENKIYIQLLIPELLDVIDKENKDMTKFDLLDKFQDLTFVIPHKLQEVVHQFRNEKKEFLNLSPGNEQLDDEDQNSSEKKDISTSSVSEEELENDASPMLQQIKFRNTLTQQSLKNSIKKKERKNSLLMLLQMRNQAQYVEEKKDGLLSLNLPAEQVKTKVVKRCQIFMKSIENGKCQYKYFKILKEGKLEQSICESIRNIIINDRVGKSRKSPKYERSPSMSPLATSSFQNEDFKIKVQLQSAEEIKNGISNPRSEGNNIVFLSEDFLNKIEGSLKKSNIDKVEDFLVEAIKVDSTTILDPSKMQNADEMKEEGESATSELSVNSYKKVENDEVYENLLQFQNQDKLNAKNENDVPKKETESLTSKISILAELRHLRSSRLEKFFPLTLQRLSLTGKLLILILLSVELVFFICALFLCSEDQNIISLIQNVNIRALSLNTIGHNTRTLTLANPNDNDVSLILESLHTQDYSAILSLLSGETQIPGLSYLDYMQSSLQFLSQNLIQAEIECVYDDLSLSSQELFDIINQEQVLLEYPSDPSLEGETRTSYPDMYNAIQTISTHINNIRLLPLQDITDADHSVRFVLSNTYNHLFYALKDKESDLILHLDAYCQTDVNIILGSLVLGSLAVFVAIVLIFPVIFSVNGQKQLILHQFLQIAHFHVAEQTLRIEKFFMNIQVGDQDPMKAEKPLGFEDESGDENAEENEGFIRKKKLEKEIHRKKNKRQKKIKFIPYKRGFCRLIVKFLIVVVLVELLFGLEYYKTLVFVGKISSLLDELVEISLQKFENRFGVNIQQELIQSKTEGSILMENGGDFLEEYIEQNENVEENFDFLKSHQKNLDENYNEDSYNEFFLKIVNENICDSLFTENEADHIDCVEFKGGTLLQGLLLVNAAFWDEIRALSNDYIDKTEDEWTDDFISQLLNDERLILNEILELRYLNLAYTELMDRLIATLTSHISTQSIYSILLFIASLLILIFIYAIFWKIFLSNTRKSLFITKSMLSIIPLEILIENKGLRENLKECSQSMTMKQ